jgi:hypothetical protein
MLQNQYKQQGKQNVIFILQRLYAVLSLHSILRLVQINVHHTIIL